MLESNSKNSGHPSSLEKGEGMRSHKDNVFRSAFQWKIIPPLVRIPMFYGLLGGLLAFGFVLLMFYNGKHPLYINPFFDIRILIIAILLVFSLKEVRDYFFGGILFFWQALFGCLVYLAAMILVSSGAMVLLGNYNEKFVLDYRKQGLEQIGLFSEATIEQIGKPAVDELKATLPTMEIGQIAQKYSFQTLIFGLFITIIISVILRRQPKPL